MDEPAAQAAAAASVSRKDSKKASGSRKVGAKQGGPPAGSHAHENVTFEDVSRAKLLIADAIRPTPCDRTNAFSKLTGTNLFFKKEHTLTTGSFKERGARNSLKRLSPEQRSKGVIAASAGNHAQGLAYHGQLLGIPVTLVMPVVAPITKVQNCRDFGARVIIHGEHIGESMEHALEIAAREDLLYINGYNHPDIIAGQGTAAMEVLEQVPDVEAIVVPIGGGGLIAGMALAVKTLRPSVKVIGVEAAACASFTAALQAGKPVRAPVKSSLADGLAVPVVGDLAFKVAKDRVDKVVTVTEKEIAIAILRLVEVGKAIVEGAGAAGLAALLANKIPELNGKNVVCVLCGGNIDLTVLGRVIERGLAADGRLVRFTCSVSDRPGGIARLTALLSVQGSSIKDIFHERAWLDSDVSSVSVRVVIEVLDRDHAERVRAALEKENYHFQWNA